MKTQIIVYGLVVLFILLLFVLIKNPIFTPEKQLPQDWQRANKGVLQRHVEHIVGVYPTRNYKNPDSLKKVADYIYQKFFEAELEIEWQEFEVKGKKYYNVIGRIGPREGEPLVIGAHYDVCNDMPGADDNASGTAGLLEVARLLGQIKSDLKRPVILVAYTLEEPPYFSSEDMGSVRHAKLLSEKGTKIKLMISLEMIGYFLDAENSQDYPSPAFKLLYPTVGNFIAILGRPQEFLVLRETKKLFMSATDLPIETANVPRFVPGLDFSDHRSYWDQGFPAVMITDTSFMRNKNYHTSGDVPEVLDYEKMAEVVNGVMAIAQFL